MELYNINYFSHQDRKTVDLGEAALNLTKRYASQSRFSNKRVNEAFSKIKEVDSYKEDSENFNLAVLQEAATRAGRTDLKEFEDFKGEGRRLKGDIVFESKLFAVVAELVDATLPAIASASLAGLAEERYLGYGDTADFIVESNETFYVWELAEGVSTGAVQRLYNNEFTLNPKPVQIRVELPWYNIVSGIFDFGNWLTRIGLSYAGYISSKVITALKNVHNQIPAGYKAQGAFDYANYIKLVERVRAANGGAGVSVWGTLSALSNIIPDAEGFSYGETGRLTQMGYIGTVAGADLIQVQQFLKPGTVNTLATNDQLAFDEDLLYFFASGDRPVKIAYEGNSTVVEKDGTNADKSVGVKITTHLAVKAVLGAIFGIYEIE